MWIWIWYYNIPKKVDMTHSWMLLSSRWVFHWSLRLLKESYARIFFSLRLKNSRSQKLKLKVFKAQTQEFLVQKLKKSETLGAILPQKSKIPMKIDVLEENLTNLSKTQGFFQNSSPKSLKNSRFRKVHLLALPKKRLKRPVIKGRWIRNADDVKMHFS